MNTNRFVSDQGLPSPKEGPNVGGRGRATGRLMASQTIGGAGIRSLVMDTANPMAHDAERTAKYDGVPLMSLRMYWSWEVETLGSNSCLPVKGVDHASTFVNLRTRKKKKKDLAIKCQQRKQGDSALTDINLGGGVRSSPYAPWSERKHTKR